MHYHIYCLQASNNFLPVNENLVLNNWKQDPTTNIKGEDKPESVPNFFSYFFHYKFKSLAFDKPRLIFVKLTSHSTLILNLVRPLSDPILLDPIPICLTADESENNNK